LITKEYTGGLELTWGNHDALLEMIEKLAYREGIGNILAEGVADVAEKIGGDSLDFAIHIKGQDSVDGNLIVEFVKYCRRTEVFTYSSIKTQ